jgi:DNA-binding helix-hairpin-helix protein with protein kinase domain
LRLSSGGGSGALVVALIFLLSLAVLYVTRQQVTQGVASAREKLRGFLARWPAEASARAFADRLRELEHHRKALLGLPDLRRRRLEEAAKHTPASQVGRFLRRSWIDGARLPGLDAGWRATLRSYGVETAEDVVPTALSQVPGLPKALRGELLGWRRGVERQFHYDPALATQAEAAEAEREIAQLRHHLEEDLRRGADDLLRLRYRIEEDRRWLRAQIGEAARELGQAEADLRYWTRRKR